MAETDTNIDEENTNNPTKDIKKYLPYVCELTESMRKKAEIRLGETPERKEKCLKELRELLENEEDLESITEDDFLLVFLRFRKFDVQGAFRMIKKGYRLKQDYEHFIVDFDLSAPQRFADSNMAGFLPYRDPKGRAIFYARPGIWDPEEFLFDDAVYGGCILFPPCLRLEANQIMGFVVIVDCENLPIQQIITLAPKYMFVVSHGLQYCLPTKVVSIHVVNPSGLVDVALKVIKPVMPDEIWKLVIIHERNNYESLHQHIPKEILPSEWGGDQDSFSNEHWVGNIPAMREEFTTKMKSGYKTKSSKYFFGLF